MKILINTVSAKKQSGGAFQISQNFLLNTLEHPEIDWYYITSLDVDSIVGPSFLNIKNSKYFVFPTQPDFKRSYYRVRKQIKEMETKIRPNVVYSITAPSYFSFKASEVMRFTNPWVTHPNKYAWSVLSIKEKIQYYLYGLLQKRLMRGAHYFITQTETCALGIKRITGEPDSHVKVVKNVLPAVFKSLENTPFRDDDCINIACVGAATTHKNFDIIPNVLKYLKVYGLEKVRIHVTLPSDEPTLGRVNRKLQRYGLSYMLVNHGRLTQKELGEMYRRCQFCFLPTLLEVFSASTLEAMYYELPIVATNFPFNREVLADSCLYYEPKNAKAAAEQIRRLVEDTALQEELRLKMQKQFTQYSDYDAHFKSIVDFLIQVGLGRK